MHIQEYVENTNKTFAQLPFNDVDAAVLCAIFYGRLENVIEGENNCDSHRGVPIREFYKQEYFEGMFSDGITDAENKKILTIAAASPRYRDIKVYNVDVKDDEATDMQFAAATFAIDDNTDFICFRGTDGSLNGWKEDFDMVFMDEIPSQGQAVDYINEYYDVPNVKINQKSLYIAGHSKGGNLAIYGATMCADRIKNQIKTCYSFDGPGFKEDVIKALEIEWQNTPLNIKKIVPETSFIGSIMDDNQNALVVRSTGILMMQHSLYTWEVNENDFVYVDNPSGIAEIFDETLRDWISGASDEQRRIFVDVLFGIFADNNMETVSDLKTVKPSDIKDILGTIKSISPEDHQVMSQLLSSLVRSTVRANVASMRGAFGLDSPEDV